MRTLLALASVMLLFRPAPAEPAVATPPKEQAEPFKLVMKVLVAGQELGAAIHFVGQSAVEFAPGEGSKPAVVFDLEAGSWRDFSPPRTMKLADAEAWAKTNADKLRSSLAKVTDPVARRFVEAMLDPKLEVVAEDGVLRMSNDLLIYEIKSKTAPPKAQLDLIHAYDRLNAYRKAMIDRKLPFAQLAVAKERAARGMIPNVMTLEMTHPKGKVKAQVDMDVQPLTAEERTRAESAVAGQAKAGPSPAPQGPAAVGTIVGVWKAVGKDLEMEFTADAKVRTRTGKREVVERYAIQGDRLTLTKDDRAEVTMSAKIVKRTADELVFVVDHAKPEVQAERLTYSLQRVGKAEAVPSGK